MARYRNLTAEPLELRLPDFRAVAEPDAQIDVPDDIAAKYVFPETLWESLDDHKTRTHTRRPAADDSEKE